MSASPAYRPYIHKNDFKQTKNNNYYSTTTTMFFDVFWIDFHFLLFPRLHLQLFEALLQALLKGFEELHAAVQRVQPRPDFTGILRLGVTRSHREEDLEVWKRQKFSCKNINENKKCFCKHPHKAKESNVKNIVNCVNWKWKNYTNNFAKPYTAWICHFD